MKQRRMRDGKVFDTKMSGDLVVDDAVSNRDEDGDQDNLGLFHGDPALYFEYRTALKMSVLMSCNARHAPVFTGRGTYGDTLMNITESLL